MKKFTSATATRGFGLMLLLVIASVGVANAQLQRTLVALGELPNPIFPTAPFQLREVKVKLAPGAVGPWHYHPGPAQIIVKRGTFKLTQDEPGCPAVEYHAGDVAIEPNGPEGSPHVHQPSNPSDDETVIYITFTLPPGTPPDQDLIPAQPQFCGE
jgi:quercetin dioxygenase-like cupin family protein